MNRKNILIFDVFRTANSKYRESVDLICRDFVKQRDGAKEYAGKFKSEDEVFADRMKQIIAESRNKLHAAQAELSESVSQQLEKLSDSLQESLCHSLNLSFIQRLTFYRETGLSPSKAEIEALLALSEGHLVALAGVDNLLFANHSKFRLKYTTVERLEKDLEVLRNFALIVPNATTIEQAEILSEILGDYGKRIVVSSHEPDMYGNVRPGDTLKTDAVSSGEHIRRLVNGKVFDTGSPVDFVALNLDAYEFSRLDNALNEMQSRWSGVSTPEIEFVSQVVADKADEAIEDPTEIVESEHEIQPVK